MGISFLRGSEVEQRLSYNFSTQVLGRLRAEYGSVVQNLPNIEVLGSIPAPQKTKPKMTD